MPYPVFRPVADHALLVEFAETIDDAAHAAVLQLDQVLAEAPIKGFREAIPAYVNLLVDFDPLLTDHAEAEAALRALLGLEAAARPAPAVREVLACYEAEFAPDLAALAERCGMSPEAVIAAHLAGDYRVYMYGFAPGYAYLGGVPEAIRQPRKPAPVRDLPAGSLMVAGPQCLVSTLTMPTGWWVIGRSPTPILTGDSFLLQVGDRVRFRRIDRAELAAAERPT
jgi:inhibitor of KinA